MTSTGNTGSEPWTATNILVRAKYREKGREMGVESGNGKREEGEEGGGGRGRGYS